MYNVYYIVKHIVFVLIPNRKSIFSLFGSILMVFIIKR